MHKPNDLLEFDVKDTLDWDSAIDDRRIEVKADDGHVTLTGSVPSYYEKVRATEDAWSVGGVKTLDNEILVGLEGAAINDSAARAGVPRGARPRPRRPQGIGDADRHATARCNSRGHVRNHFQRDAAEFVVSRLDGVLGIENLIAISSEPIPSDVADRVNKAFKRNAIIDDSNDQGDQRRSHHLPHRGRRLVRRHARRARHRVASTRRRQRRQRSRDRAVADRPASRPSMSPG